MRTCSSSCHGKVIFRQLLILAYLLIQIVLNVKTTESHPCASSDFNVGQHQRWSSRPGLRSSQRSCFGLIQQSYYSTQEAEKEPEEEPLHNIITDSESVEGEVETINHVLSD